MQHLMSYSTTPVQTKLDTIAAAQAKIEIKFAMRMIHRRGFQKLALIPGRYDGEWISRRKVKRACLANLGVWRTFVTLTYDPAHVLTAHPSRDIRNYTNRIRNGLSKPGNRADWISYFRDLASHAQAHPDSDVEKQEKLLKYYMKSIIWLTNLKDLRSSNYKQVWRVEKGEKTGRVHLHLMTSQFIPRDIIEYYWAKGRIDTQFIKRYGDLDDVHKVAKYISKYISKKSDYDLDTTEQTGGPTEFTGRRWGISRGLDHFIPQWFSKPRVNPYTGGEELHRVPACHHLLTAEQRSIEIINLNKWMDLLTEDSAPAVLDNLMLLELESLAFQHNILIKDQGGSKTIMNPVIARLRYSTILSYDNIFQIKDCLTPSPKDMTKYYPLGGTPEKLYAKKLEEEPTLIYKGQVFSLGDDMTLEKVHDEHLPSLMELSPLLRQRVAQAHDFNRAMETAREIMKSAFSHHYSDTDTKP